MSYPERVTLRVDRTGPDGTPAGTSTYELTLNDWVTVGQLLLQVRMEEDPTLVFRYSCGLGRCGTCTAYVNGKPVLTCQETVKQSELHISALPKRQVLRDLMVRADKGT